MHAKDFLKWMELKEELHFSSQKTPFVSEGQIWWASLGENVGFEINGKSNLITRPVLVLKKFSKQFYFVIPITTKLQTGTWYSSFKLHGKIMTACLHQARSLDYRRLYSKLGRLDDKDYKRIKESFSSLCL